MNKVPIFFTSIIIILLSVSCLDDELTEVSITHEETITSQIINDDYKLYFFLPPNYSESKEYPVVYLLDGDWHTERMANEINVMWKNNEIPECILIGIGNSNQRFRDYTYPPDKYNEGSGHADEYYEFIRDELIPYVDASYTTDTSSRIIAGHSLGGFFVLYAMFQNNSDLPLFSGIIAASPSIWWENAYLLELEQELAEKTDDLPVSLFLSAGSDEGITNMLDIEMRERLLNREYPSFNSNYINFKDKGHEGASIPGFVEGIKFTLNN